MANDHGVAGVPRLHWRWNYRVLAMAACLFPVTLALGFWQLHRADEKRALLEVHAGRAAADPVPFAGIKARADNDYLRVVVTGKIDNERVFLVDNRVRHGRPGYEVVSPLRTDDGRWLLVNRGWIQAGLDRRVLPVVPPLTGEVKLTGYLYRNPGKPFSLGDDQWQPGRWPQIVQHVEPERLEERLGVDLFPYSLRLEASASPGLEPGWEIVNLPPSTHIGYAVQWFALAATLLVLTVFANSNLAAVLRRSSPPHG